MHCARMRSITAALTCLLLALGPAQNPSLDSIVRNHIEALGGAKAIAAITSVVERGW